MKSVFYCIATLLIVTACSDDNDGEHVAPDKPPSYMLYSPNAEPLNGGPLGKPACEKALGGWFDHMSTEGRISEGVFMKDASVQFTRMDIDHNGYIVSEELDRFRAPYRQAQPEAPEEKSESKSHEGHGKHKDKDRTSHSDPSLSMSDPVMSADTNLDFKVSPAEFTLQAHDIFAKLDADHDGLLTRQEVLTQCEKKTDKK